MSLARDKAKWVFTFLAAIGLFLTIYLAALTVGHRLAGPPGSHDEAAEAVE